MPLSVNDAAMAGRLILICHAETAATRRAAFADSEGLSERGRVAAGARAASLPVFDTCLTSPAPATQETARALGLNSSVDEALRDLDAGCWRGQTLAQVAQTDADAAHAWFADPAFDAHGGESLIDLIARTTRWRHGRRENSGTTLAVTHPSVVRANVIGVLDASPSAFWRIESAPLTMVELGSDGRRWTLCALTRP